MKNKKSSFGKAFLSKKMFVLVAIAVCTLILSAVAFPALLTGASTDTDEWTLDIYGNANEDDTIDMRDVTYTKLAIFGKKPETELADAFYDGEVDVLDVVQIKLIILGRESELTIVDGRGTAVTINKPVNRIVAAITPTHFTVLRALKSTENVVGVCKVVKKAAFFPEFSDLPGIGGYPVDIERIYGLNPDLVFANVGCSYAEPTVEGCEDAGITVFCWHVAVPETLSDNITKIGYIFDKEDEAKEFIDFIQYSTVEIEEKVKDIPEDEKPKVYLETVYGDDYRTCCKQSYPSIVATLAGGKNIAYDIDLPGNKKCTEVDPEWVIEQNPDIIIRIARISESGYITDDVSEVKAMRDEIMSRPELAGVKAVKNGQVYVMSCNIVRSTAYRIGVPYMAKVFYPDLFEDLDYHAVHQQYLTEFQGLDFDVYEQGVFIYPPLE